MFLCSGFPRAVNQAQNLPSGSTAHLTLSDPGLVRGQPPPLLSPVRWGPGARGLRRREAHSGGPECCITTPRPGTQSLAGASGQKNLGCVEGNLSPPLPADPRGLQQGGHGHTSTAAHPRVKVGWREAHTLPQDSAILGKGLHPDSGPRPFSSPKHQHRAPEGGRGLSPQQRGFQSVAPRGGGRAWGSDPGAGAGQMQGWLPSVRRNREHGPGTSKGLLIWGEMSGPPHPGHWGSPCHPALPQPFPQVTRHKHERSLPSADGTSEIQGQRRLPRSLR